MDDPLVKPTHTLHVEDWRLGLGHDVTSVVEFDSPLQIIIRGHTHYERLAP